MGEIYLIDDRESIQDEKATPLMSKNDEGSEEEDQSSVKASEIRTKSKKRISKHPLILDIKQPNNSQEHNLKSFPFSNKLTTTDYISFLGLAKNLSQYRSDLFCRVTSLLNIPIDLRRSEFFVVNLKYSTRTRSTTSLSVTRPKNIIISTSGQWIFGSVEGTLNATTLLKSSLPLRLATVDSTMSRISARKSNTGQTKSLKSANSPSRLSNSSPQDHKAKVDKSDSKVSGEMHGSCSSTNSTCSSRSTSSVCKGQLHCMWKSGTPYFVFKVGDDCSELYVANQFTIESSADKAMDYIYLFRSRISNSESSFVGKMKVSSSLTLNSDSSKAVETEFVLFGADRSHSNKMKSSAKNKGLSKKVADIFKSNHSFKRKSKCKIGRPSSRIEDFLQGPSLSELTDFDESSLVNHLEDDFPHNNELAAIVINDYRRDRNEEEAVGGWGLKFLEKITGDRVGTLESSFSPRSGEGTARSMKVLVPAGFHGGPTTIETGGPSSLTERWRSGGHCDCDGWDVGCPLTVLGNSIVSEDFPQQESKKDCKSISLFIEGAKHDEPTLKMVKVNEGVYSIYFQSTLSALQSFSIGVAIIHTQIPALDPKL